MVHTCLIGRKTTGRPSIPTKRIITRYKTLRLPMYVEKKI
jgi:hypothetical protein